MDITSNNLALAMLDQRVEGAFSKTPHAYVAVIAEGGWGLGIAVANERGYNPITGFNYKSDKEARAIADGMNKHIGVSADDVSLIVASTMGGRPFGRRVA